ncbi:unnamed protein product, partial [Sphacelaria rigidula]
MCSDLAGVKPRTVLKWADEFKKTKGYFKRDGRGVYEREWIFNEEDLKLKLLRWLKSQKRLTINSIRRYINDGFFEGEGGMMKLKRYNLTLPISASTIHSWVTKLGCTYERHSQSYYTDGHERPDV